MPPKNVTLDERYSQLAKEIAHVILELTRDAETHGFDVTPHLKRLAALELFSLTELPNTAEKPNRPVH